MAAYGLVRKYKACLVAKGFSWVHGIDYIETFSLIAKMDSIILFLAIAIARRWEVHHMKSAFLHEYFEEVYME
jgi:hypothetical protein